MRPAGRRVRSVSLGSLGFAPGVGGFIRGCLVHWGSPWAASGSSGVAVFTGVRRGERLVHPGLLESLGYALEVVRLIRESCVH